MIAEIYKPSLNETLQPIGAATAVSHEMVSVAAAELYL